MTKSKRVSKKKESKILKGLKFLGKATYQVLRIAAGSYTVATGALTFNPVVAWNGIEAISNVICASIKDKPSKKSKLLNASMGLFNFMANNVGKAANDPKRNK